MAIYDTEQFLRDLETVMKANLNTKITAINTEKGDFEIANINDGAWYFQNLNSEVFSYAQFIAWGLGNSPDSQGEQNDNYMERIRVMYEVCLADEGERSSRGINYKLLRYQRAMKEVVLENFDSYRGHTKTLITSLTPTSFTLDGKLFRSAGIQIQAALTAR